MPTTIPPYHRYATSTLYLINSRIKQGRALHLQRTRPSSAYRRPGSVERSVSVPIQRRHTKPDSGRVCGDVMGREQCVQLREQELRGGFHYFFAFLLSVALLFVLLFWYVAVVVSCCVLICSCYVSVFKLLCILVSFFVCLFCCFCRYGLRHSLCLCLFIHVLSFLVVYLRLLNFSYCRWLQTFVSFTHGILLHTLSVLFSLHAPSSSS